MKPESVKSLDVQQAHFNRSTRGHWDHFADHRRKVEELLLPGGIRTGGSLCVLGAGNCNDLSLPRLVRRFNQIHLVDLDAPALESAIARQGLTGDRRILVHAPVDLTGIANDLSGWRRRSPAAAEIEELLRRADQSPPPRFATEDGPFNSVLAPCILSQVTGYAADVLGREHPRCGELRRFIRQRFLRLMVALLRPGGAGIIVSDMASGETPEFLSGSSRTDLGQLISKRVGQGRFFSGLDPDSLRDGLLNDPRVGLLISDLHVIQPWVWTLGPEKAFLVYAVRMRRSTAALLPCDNAVRPGEIQEQGGARRAPPITVLGPP